MQPQILGPRRPQPDRFRFLLSARARRQPRASGRGAWGRDPRPPRDLGPGRVRPVGPAALPGRASTESYILQLIMPVLCVTQSIHSPLYMAWAVMMLSPAYELICH